MLLNKNNFLRWDGEFSVTELVSIVFADQNGVNINTELISNPLTISGLFAPRSISVVGALMKINDGAFIAGPATIENGDVLILKMTSGLNYEETTTATVTIGQNTGSFTARTKAAPLVNIYIQNSELGDPYIDVNLQVSANGNVVYSLWTNDFIIWQCVAGTTLQAEAFTVSGVWPPGAGRTLIVSDGGNFICNTTERDQNVNTVFSFVVRETPYYVIGAYYETS